jgi:tetratricopeptide (TPR) repeat protein
VTQSPGLGAHTFVGRDRELAEIEALLTRATDVQLRAALDGLPGIGKTELARQVVARLARGKKFPGGIYWFNAEHADLRMQWAHLAEDSGCPALPDLDARARWAVREIEQRAQQGDAILLVLDNVETWSPPPAPLPDVSAIQLLVTTRVRWLHNSFRPYEVPPLELAPARALLHAIVGRQLPREDEMLAALGGHVLSIELAATYLREYGTSPAEYLAQLMAGKSPGASVAEQTSYRTTAENAFRLLWQRIAPPLRAAWVLAAQLPPTWFSTELAEAIGLDTEQRRGLVRLHILERDHQGRHQMHRLLREFALAEQPEAAPPREAVIRGATKLLNSEDEALTFQRYRRDADSFEYLVATFANVPESAALRAACGYGLRQLGDLPAARALLEQALAYYVEVFGNDHPEAAVARNNLAVVLRDLGDLPAARILFEQALASDRNTYGDDHPRVATHRNNLALLVQDLGDLPAARILLEQALASDRNTYGDDHPEVTRDRNNLGLLLRDLGDLPAARVLLEQALASDRKTYGDDHPTVATKRNNLALLVQDLGDLPAARVLFEQALASDLKTYGDDHPEVATTRSNLGSLLLQLGDLPGARVLMDQALASRLKTYGDNHPEVATARSNLALLLLKLGDLPAARVLLEQALVSDLKTYGDDHPAVALKRNNLAWLLRALGDLPAARILFEQALASDRKTYGDDHPKTAIRRYNLALLLQQLGDLPGARMLMEQALASFIAAYGDNHPHVAIVRLNLATLIEASPPS